LKEQCDKGVDLDRLVQIVVSQLSFVAITLDPEDNPYRIFESLNAKGMPLTQGDLLRNYFFMRLPPGEHEHWYASVWNPMQVRLGERFDDFMRDFLLKEGQPIRPDEVYQEWRKRLGPLDEENIRDVLRELAEWSVEYDQILHPQRESDVAVRRQLQRLTAWSKTVPYQFNPLLLRVHSDYRRGKLSGEQVQRVFQAIESLMVRRMFTSAPVRDENQILIGLYDSAPTRRTVHRRSSTRCPIRRLAGRTMPISPKASSATRSISPVIPSNASCYSKRWKTASTTARRCISSSWTSSSSRPSCRAPSGWKNWA